MASALRSQADVRASGHAIECRIYAERPRLAATLRSIAIEGVETNLAFLQRVLAHPAFRAGEVRTGFVERHKAALLI